MALAIEAEGAGTEQMHPDALRAERKREADRVRIASCRATVALQSRDTAEKESFPHTPFKENTSTLKGFGDISREAVSKPVLPEGFPEFRNVYPKRDGNADWKSALRAYVPALKRASAAELIAGAMRYAAHCDTTEKTGTGFVRQARTWLNADGWKEEYINAKPNGNPLRKSNATHDSCAIVGNAITAERIRIEAELAAIEGS